MGDEESKLPPKVYFRIGEVASLVGVEPHVLRYWEREFRTIRPKKSARGQRVYSRKDVETLMRVRQLLYSERFTIAGARRRLQQERSSPVEITELAELAVHDGESQPNEPAIAGPRIVAQADGHAPARQAERAPAPVIRSPRAESATEASPEAEPPPRAPPRLAVDLAERELEPVQRITPAAHVGRLERADGADRVEQGAMRSTLRELRREIETFLSEL